MKILKYLFLLLLLSAFGTTVFFLTQKGDYSVKRSLVIKTSRSATYNYINDYRNWEYFYSPDNTYTDFVFGEKTSGIKSGFNWTSANDEGSFITTDCKENKSISQTMTYDGYVSEVNWTFKDTVGGTKITWHSKGILPFGKKMFALLNGGADKSFGNEYTATLKKIDQSLHHELTAHSIEIAGRVTKLGANYIYYPINSKISNIAKNFKAIVPKLNKFISDKDLEKIGKPFLMYNRYDTINNIANIFVCQQLKNEYISGPESEILSGKFDSFQAVKATLTGNYTHLDETYDKLEKYISSKNIIKEKTIPFIEVYRKSGLDVKKQSKWITDIYIPIFYEKPKPVVISAPTYIQPNNSDSTYVAKNQVSETGERKPIKSVSTGIKKKKVTKTEEPVIVPVKVEEIPNYEGAP